MKKFILSALLLLVFISPLLVACGSEKLSTPTEILVQKENERVFVCTNKVDNANYYLFNINGKDYNNASVKFDATEFLSVKGTYLIKVKAVSFNAGILESDYSEVITYSNVQKLGTPTIEIINNEVYFNTVENATSYTLFINGSKLITTKNNFSLITTNEITNYLNFGQVNSFKVKANETSNYLDGDISNEITYLLKPVFANPKNLSINDNNSQIVLNFDKVENVDSYTVCVSENVGDGNEKEYQTNTNSFNITNFIKDIKTYSFKVKSNESENGFESVYSDAVTYTPVLATPKNLLISTDLLSFSSVRFASEYIIFVNDTQVITITNTSLDLSTLNLEVGTNKINVKAKCGESVGQLSESINYVVQEVLVNPVAISVSIDGSSYKFNFTLVKYAVSYVININGQDAITGVTGTTATITYDVTSALRLGINSLKVKAIGKETVTEYSNTVNCTFTKTLASPTNLQVYAETGKYYLEFDEINGASSYDVIVRLQSNETPINVTVNKVDLTDYLTVDARYNIQVVSKSNEQYINNGVSETLNFDCKTYSKQSYENQSYFFLGMDKTYAIKNDDEFVDFILYCVLYRKTSVEIYMDYNYYQASENPYGTTSLIQKLIPSLKALGVDINNLFTINNISKIKDIIYLIERAHDQIYLYFDASSSLTSQRSDKVYTINFTYDSVEDAYITKNRPLTTDSGLPTNMATVRTRSDSFNNFYIESLPSAPVETSNQLLMVVENGRKPEFTKTGTVAEQAYEKAKQVLREIITDDMTDIQKALAIHDYIVTTNTYCDESYEMAKVAPFSAENTKLRSFAVEGMLIDNLSVCDGISRAFSLLCNIEGIKTIKCFGITINLNWDTIAFDVLFGRVTIEQIQSASGHSWNRINIDEQWYIVDCTWDDKVIGSTEYLSHEFFLVDETAIADRTEFYPNGYYADTFHPTIDYSATSNYNYFNQMMLYANSVESLENIVLAFNSEKGVEIKVENVSDTRTIIENTINQMGLSSNSYTIANWGKFWFITKK